MGFKIDEYCPILSINIEKGDITLTDVQGKLYTGKTHSSVNLSETNSTNIPFNLHLFTEKNSFLYCINYDYLLCIYTKSKISPSLTGYELYVTYTVDLPDEITRVRKYIHVGYYNINGNRYFLMIDEKVLNIVHIVDKFNTKIPKGTLILEEDIIIPKDLIYERAITGGVHYEKSSIYLPKVVMKC